MKFLQIQTYCKTQVINHLNECTMKNRLIIYLAFIGFIALFVSCEKDEDKVVMLEAPAVPSIVTLPNLTLQRINATDTVEFMATPVDPGFNASTKYFIEAAIAGTNFADPLVVFTGVKITSIKMTVSYLNGILLKKFDADKISSLDFRLRSVLVVDAGTGAPGTSDMPFEYVSLVKTADVTIYGLPRLDLINSGLVQKIESPLGNGIYNGFVKLDATKAFTLLDPDSDMSYGAAGSALAVNGAGIIAGASGWHQFSADVNALTYSVSEYQIGLVGSATPNAWNSPDTKMNYDSKSGTWKITVDLIDGEYKFRKNDGWAWNLGLAKGGSKVDLVHNGDNIAVKAGNYTLTLTIVNDAGEIGTFTIVKN